MTREQYLPVNGAVCEQDMPHALLPKNANESHFRIARRTLTDPESDFYAGLISQIDGTVDGGERHRRIWTQAVHNAIDGLVADGHDISHIDPEFIKRLNESPLLAVV